MAARFSSPYVFFDALDECEDHEAIVSLIQQLSVSHIKVMFTSRDHLEILKVFGSVALSISAQGADIQKYISFRLQTERRHHPRAYVQCRGNVRPQVFMKLTS